MRRAAVLFALLLELQGRDEATISRRLDELLPDPAEPGPIAVGDAAACRRWLDTLRARLETAHQAEHRG